MNPLSRRGFLKTGLASGVSLVLPSAYAQAPAVVTSDRSRPQTPSGLQIGDVLADRAVIWSRSDRPSRLWVEHSLSSDFASPVRVRGPLALETSDYTARVDVTGLPADREVFVRVLFEDVSTGRAFSEPLAGRLRTAPAKPRDVNFLWSGDTAGQGFGINPDWGGMKIYEAMRKLRPDFFVHSGDNVYADGPIAAELKLDDGTVWKNVVTEETSKVAESLREFRGRYAYNLMDENVRRFSAEVPQIWQWDDHEVMNNYSDSKDISGDARYVEKSVPLLVARATRAFLEYAPMRYHGIEESERVYRKIPYGPLLDVFVLDMRSYRGGNGYNRQENRGPDAAFIGDAQLAWLKQSLKGSKALWKVIAADMPLSLQVLDGKDAQGRTMFEAVANGDGPPLGRELEFADLFSSMKRDRVRNVVWLTADVHYTAAHYYDPAKAQFTDFDPFWEFVSGPLNAGSFGPNALDNTFGPQVVYQKAPEKQNTPPTAGLQFFGQVQIAAKTGAMTVTLRDLTGASLYSKKLEARRA